MNSGEDRAVLRSWGRYRHPLGNEAFRVVLGFESNRGSEVFEVYESLGISGIAVLRS